MRHMQTLHALETYDYMLGDAHASYVNAVRKIEQHKYIAYSKSIITLHFAVAM